MKVNLIFWKIFLKHLNVTRVLKKKAIYTTEKFSFRHVKDDEVRRFIMNLQSFRKYLRQTLVFM